MCTRILIRVVVLLSFFTLAGAEAFAQIYYVKEMNTEQFRALDREKTVVLLPGGILEQHGPYLPSFSDGYMNERLTQELADAIVARPGWKVLIFPLIPLGTVGANEIGGKYVFPGTYAVRSATLRAVFMDLATELGEQGFRWIFVIHVHGAPPHSRVLDQASDYFRETYGGHMVHLWGLMPVFEAINKERATLPESQQKEDGFSVHAGMGETSLQLFLQPGNVSVAYKNAPPQTGQNSADLVRIAKAENWPGHFGSPRLASAAFGARVWKTFSATFIEFALKILDGFDYRSVPRWSDVAKTDPEFPAVVNASLVHEQEIERKQQEWLRKKGLE